MTAPIDAPAPPPRPRTVTVAFWLQLAAVVVLLGLLALVVVQAVLWDGRIDDAVRAVPDADPDEVSAERWINVTGSLFIGVPILLLAVWYAATALPVRRGGKVARILVFVAAGGQLLVCLGQGCLGALFLPMLFVAGPGEGEVYPGEEGVPEDFWEESPFLDALYGTTDPFEAVFFPLGMLGVLGAFLLTAAVVLLLALPPAHRWFVPAAPPKAAVPPAFPPFGPPYLAPGHAPPAFLPPGYVPPGPVPPGYAPPGYVPPGPVPPAFLPPGYVPPGYVPPGYVPPGHLLCPDPAAHAPRPGADPAGPDTPDSSANET